jgi:hypothetical protein
MIVVTSAPSISAGGGILADHHLLNGNANNGHTPSKPSGCLTSPMSELTPKCNVGLRHAGGGGLSSLPSSASTSPGLPISRPSTPMTVALAGSQPVSPYFRGGGAGQQQTLANKRTFHQRCDEDNSCPAVIMKNGSDSSKEPDSKRPRLNGNSSDYLIGEVSISSDNNANNVNSVLVSIGDSSVSNSQHLTATPSIPTNTSDFSDAAQSGRRKNRAGRTKEEAQDGLVQRMASIRKSSGKVRTTQELVQELALRSHSPHMLSTTVVNHQMSAAAVLAMSPNHLKEETKTELMNRFLQSQSDVASPLPLPSSLTNDQPSDGRETIETILSKLPQINTEAILAEIEAEVVEEDDDLEVEGLIPVMPKPKPDTGPEVLATLHNGQKESFNGNFNHEGDFNEWFEVVSKRTKDNELIYILPYCVIE